MTFSLFINFDGQCREAVDYYAKVFKSEVRDLMTYAQMPPDPEMSISEADKDRVLYACVPIFGCNVMFCDTSADMPFIKGNNISPTLGCKDKEEMMRIFNALKEGGEVGMDLQQTFWSELFGMVTDKYGVIWQLSHEA